MPDWTEVAVDGEPPSDMSGGVTLYEIYDGMNVHLTGRFNDTWMLNIGWEEPTHWKLWSQSEPPPADGWTSMDDFVAPSMLFTLIEIYDGSVTSLTGWYMNRWIFEVPDATDWRLPNKSDPPA